MALHDFESDVTGHECHFMLAAGRAISELLCYIPVSGAIKYINSLFLPVLLVLIDNTGNRLTGGKGRIG